jgi:hypothetical protein
MRIAQTDYLEERATARGWSDGRKPLVQSRSLYLVTPQELEELRSALARGHVPLDFERKLNGLAGNDLTRAVVEQNCRLFIALLLAAQSGRFEPARPDDCERLLRVLAYVRKDDDAIADYKPNGFADDVREVRAAATELSQVLQTFKKWRLCHQVPAMWSTGRTLQGLAPA